MKIKHLIAALLGAFALLLVSALPASAAGSDGPTPYTVTSEGIYLPAGDSFGDGDHVNARADDGRTYSIHFEAKYADPSHPEWRNLPFNAADPRNQFYGQSFIPWSGLGLNQKAPYCVEWVQIAGYNEHFGDGGQEPVGTGCQNPPDLVETGQWSQPTFTCDSKVGDVVDRTREVTVTRYNHDGSVKDQTKTTEAGTHVVTEVDLLGLECRTAITPISPQLTPAAATCVDEVWQETSATVALAEVSGGHWTVGGNPVSGVIELTEPTEFVFVVDDQSTHYTQGETAFTFEPVVPTETACELAESGGSLPLMGLGIAAGAMVGGGLLIARRKRAA